MTASSPSAPHVGLIDGSGFIFRAFFALPPLTRPDGTPVNAVLGFTNMLMKLRQDLECDHLAVAFDHSRVSFRTEIYPDYKAHRPDPPPELVPQFPLVREAAQAFNIVQLEQPGFEADDLIATYARLAAAEGFQVTIVSSDKDLMQLVGGAIKMFDPVKNRPIGPDEVMAKFGVGPEKVVDVQALAGDSTDNVPGVPGIGVKTAAQLITDFGDLESLLARAEEIRQPKRRQTLLDHAEAARISHRLVRLDDHAPVSHDLAALKVCPPDGASLRNWLSDQGFRSILNRLDGVTRADGPTPDPNGSVPIRYELVQERADLGRWIARCRQAGRVAIDTETTGLAAMRAELVGISLSDRPGQACYIPLGHRNPEAEGDLALAEPPRQIPLKDALADLADLFADPGVLKIGHNLKYDLLVLKHYGIEVTPWDDTMLMSYVLDAGRHGHGLDELAERHLNHTTIPFKDVAGSGRKQVTFDRVPLDKARDYAAEDADICLRLAMLGRKRLGAERLTTVYETLERPLVPVIADMEQAGVRVDLEALHRLSHDFATRMAELEAEIHALAGRPFNIASPRQMGEVLFGELGLPGGRKTRTGGYSTDVEVLEGLADQHDIVGRILDWRQVAKLKSTYADALAKAIDPATGRVHTSFSLAAAQTGRLSSSDPNLQNIPVRTDSGRGIRRAFVAAPGHKLLSLDYSQIELRLLAAMTEVPALAQAFHDGIDIHALTASRVFGRPLDQVDGELRRRAKAVNFGIIYGISGFGLGRQLGCTTGEANEIIKAYLAEYAGIKDYMEAQKERARRQGHVTTLFGRRCHLPQINDRNAARRAFAERQAINAPIQGTAADIIKRAMIRVPGALAGAGLTGRMLLQVHDELLFEVPEAEVDATIATVRAVMVEAPKPAVTLAVPLVVDAGIGANWAEAH